MDGNLTWKHHVDYIASKISKIIGIIVRLRHFVLLSTLLTIYQSLVFPYMSYGVAIWGQAAQTHLNKLLLLQKRALRLMHFTSSREHAIPFFVSKKTLPINLFYHKSVLCLMHDVSNKWVPSNILDLFTETNGIHSHFTRATAAGNFCIKYSTLNIQNESFSRLGAKDGMVFQKDYTIPKEVFLRKKFMNYC